MSHGPSRRAALLAATGCALVLPVVRPGTAHAADTVPTPTRELPPATHSRHPAAQYAPEAARSAYAEPLNATVDCAVGRRERD
ncbi:hypothetical protein [Streptomyces sp. B93]|uniref:hypothetical protein n=1 Tax=Streptomyces sp. B93 TaxID=2824875 RepID=UPI001B39AE36|nr:hypothetical protein [Streptomyces sp. B93]MBQ1090003.1 hypothetical protein [Streptomyces sp. B93]